MIKSKVNEDIELHLVHASFVTEYVELARSDFDHLAKWLEWPRFCKSATDFNEFISQSVKAFEAGETMHCGIKYKGAIVGVAGFNKIDLQLQRVEIGYWIGSQYEGKGIATSVCQHLIEYAFKELSVTKIQIAVAEENRRSRMVCQRLNMKLEGIISNEEKVGDTILSHAVYGLHRTPT